ncbi:MAG: transaldolase, partial [Pseudomonadota bacterium]
LAGCDLLTIAPELLAQLDATDGDVPNALVVGAGAEEPTVRLDEAGFRWALNQDAMATDKLSEGIRAFATDAVKLDGLLQAR